MVLKSRVPAPDWSANENPDREAKCRKFPLPTNHEVNADTDPWFYDEPEAALVCNGTYDNRVCPFRQVCLYGALVNNEQAGTFGGFSTLQRRWIRRNTRGPDAIFSRIDWEESDRWRDQVPSHERLVEEEDARQEEDSEES